MDNIIPDKSLTKNEMIAAAYDYVDSGDFVRELTPLVAIKTESPREDSYQDHIFYLETGLRPMLEAMGFQCRILENPVKQGLPALFAERIEGSDLPTVLTYGHGDVLWGMDGDWSEGRSPWRVDVADGRIYGRGTVDNKGQHLINLAAARLLIDKTGRLGFNLKVFIESGEESGSSGLAEIAEANRNLFLADVLIASDGPRVSDNTPTIFLGARGGYCFDLVCNHRTGAYHSGNWGGLLVNAGIRLVHALACITDARGKILIDAWRPKAIPYNVRKILADVQFERSGDEPNTDIIWGEPGLSDAEQVYGWCNFEVLAFTCGRPEAPVNAIPGSARASCQLRYVVDIERDKILPALRQSLDSHGFDDVKIETKDRAFFNATRTDADNPWVLFAINSIQETTGKKTTLLPNLGGSLPNEVFLETLGMPTIWVPHSHPSCSQHAPDEHMLLSIARESEAIMVGLFFDIGCKVEKK